jgi:hypothetical protein
VNRWRQRLAKLHGDGTEPLTAFPRTVQNGQNAQNPATNQVFEHSEQIEQQTERPRAPISEPRATDRAAAVWSAAEDERAAIIEHDGKIPREWAEGFARLDPDRPPGDVPSRRWLRFIDDVGAFLDSPFCAVAAALGWGPYDLFGCDRDRPFARVDRAGLLWLLNGDRLVMLTDDVATIEMSTGVRQTWRRKRDERDRVLAWELAR